MSEAVAAPVPKPYKLQREEGGKVPEIGQLLSATIAEFMDNIGPYVLAGVGQFIVGMVLTMIMIPLLYIVIFGVMFGGMFASVGLAIAVEEATGDPDLGGLAASLGSLGMMFFMVVAMFAMIGVMSAITAPFQASLQRAVAAHQRGEGKLELSAGFSTMTQDIVAVMLVTCGYLSVVILGSMMCYVPALGAMLLLSFAPSLVYLKRMGAIEALRTASSHSMAHLGFYFPFVMVFFAISLFAAYIPVIGPMFALAFHVRATREMFGDA